MAAANQASNSSELPVGPPTRTVHVAGVAQPARYAVPVPTSRPSIVTLTRPLLIRSLPGQSSESQADGPAGPCSPRSPSSPLAPVSPRGPAAPTAPPAPAAPAGPCGPAGSAPRAKSAAPRLPFATF